MENVNALKKDLNVIVMNDMCSYGKVSLTVNIPVLSAFSIKVSPLPTVLLSNHTQYPSFCAFDMTKYLVEIIKEIKKLKVKFDAFYIGWLGDRAQVDLAISIIEDFNIPITLIDPILGDNEKLYSPITNEQVSNMRELIKYGDIIVPNTTEFSALMGLDINEKPSINTIKENIYKLRDLGPKNIIVTSVVENEKVGTMTLANDKITTHLLSKLPIHIPGTGDAFASSFLGYLLRSMSIEEASVKATDFLHKSVSQALRNDNDRTYGIPIEDYLDLL